MEIRPMFLYTYDASDELKRISVGAVSQNKKNTKAKKYTVESQKEQLTNYVYR